MEYYSPTTLPPYYQLLKSFPEVVRIKQKRQRKLSFVFGCFRKIHRFMQLIVTSLCSTLQCEYEIMLHPPYRLNLAPGDFLFFPKTNKPLCGCNISDDQNFIPLLNWKRSGPRWRSFTSGRWRRDRKGITLWGEYIIRTFGYDSYFLNISMPLKK